jgi:cation:H+ antiporter
MAALSTVVAVCTSLPELAAALIAAIRGEREIAVGTVIGSNLFNLLAVAGTVQVLADAAPKGLARTLDLPVLALASALVAGLLLVRQRMDRAAALLLLGVYAGWLVLRLLW